MADAVDTLTVHKGKRRQTYRFTNASDGTGEAAVVKVDKSTLVGQNGLEPSKLIVEKIQFSTDGMSVRLFWDHTTDDEICTLAGHGTRDWTSVGGLIDPASAGGTGDILFTTVGHTSGDSYDITLHLRLKD